MAVRYSGFTRQSAEVRLFYLHASSPVRLVFALSEVVLVDLLHPAAAPGATDGLVEGHTEALVAVDVAEAGSAVAGF